MIIADPGTDQYADGKAARVWQMYIGGTSKRTQIYKKFLVDILKKHNCRTIFDVACGTGVDSVMFLEEGFEVQSADISDKMLKQAYKTRWERRKEDLFDQWIIQEANWLTLEDDMEEYLPEEGYDAILCMGNSFAHLPDYYGDHRDHIVAIKQFYNLLKPGGILLIDHRNYDYILDYGKAPPHNIYYDSSYIVDLKTSILYENGCATLIQLDYQMDITSIMKKKKKKNGMIVRKDDAVKSPKNEDCYSNKTASNNRQVAKYRSSESDSDVEKKLEKFELSNGISEPENYSFRLCYYPHRLTNFTKLLKSVFGSATSYQMYADFKPMRSEPNPAFYIHAIQKVK